MLKRFSKNSFNSLLLSAVNLLTKFSAVISTMILSHSLDLALYGTYSQTNLLVTTATSLCALGLVDSMNYFFNKSSDPEVQKRYVNTVLFLQILAGALAALLILLFPDAITAYFGNPKLRGFLPLLAFRPLLVNVSIGFQYLHISIGRSISAALRNGTMAVLRIVVVSVAAFVTSDITVILIAYLLFEIFFTVNFYHVFGKLCFYIRPLRMDKKLVREILAYSIPLGIYIITSSLNRDIDKLLIARWYTTEEYAVYANCATVLPFGIIASSFMTILMPVMTRFFGQKEYGTARKLFRSYLKIGYYSAFTFTIPFILLSREAIMILYGSSYLSGQNIFILYILVSTIQFASMSFVLSACGRSRTLMLVSVISMPLNLLLNFIGHALFGMIGPAIATVIVTAVTTVLLMYFSAEALRCRMDQLFDRRDLLFFLVKLVLATAVCVVMAAFLRGLELSSVLIFIIAGGLYILAVLAMNGRNIYRTLKVIDRLK